MTGLRLTFARLLLEKVNGFQTQPLDCRVGIVPDGGNHLLPVLQHPSLLVVGGNAPRKLDDARALAAANVDKHVPLLVLFLCRGLGQPLKVIDAHEHVDALEV